MFRIILSVKSYDVRTGQGFLTVDDLKKTFTQIAPHLPSHAVAAAFR